MKKVIYPIFLAGLIVTCLINSAGATTIAVLDQSDGRAWLNAQYMETYGIIDDAVLLTTSDFNSMTPEQLLANYDAMIFGWISDPNTYNADWNTVILSYLQGGGGVIWEDPNNRDDLGGSGLNFGYSYSGNRIVHSVEGLTADGSIPLAHLHFTIDSYASDWSPLVSFSNYGTASVYGEFGSGRIIVSGDDSWYHTYMPSAIDTSYGQFLVNEVTWVTGGVSSIPEPASMMLLCTGIGGLIGTRLRRKAKTGACA